MKRKLVSIMALSLCLCMGMSTMTACNDGDNGDNSGSSGSSDSGSSTSLTDDEILAKVHEAYLNSLAYEGPLTINASGLQESWGPGPIPDEESDEDPAPDVSTYFICTSVDPAINRMYREIIDDSDVVEEKIFKSGDTYYRYWKSSLPSSGEVMAEGEGDASPEEGQETYEVYFQGDIASDMKDCSMAGLLGGTYGAMIGAYTSVESVAEFNAALETIMVDVENQYETRFEGATATQDVRIVCTENADSCMVDIVMTAEITVTEETFTGSVVINRTISITEKDGKLAEFSMKDEQVSEETAITEEEGVEPETVTSGYRVESLCELSYAFDQAGYDSITVTAPEGLEAEEDYRKDFNVVINGVENYTVYGYGETAREAMEYAYSKALDDLGNAGGVNIVWYKDESCTQEIDVETLTAAEYYEIDTLYGKATLKEGYAFVIEEEKTVAANDLPEAYKIFVETYSLVLGEYKFLRVVAAGEVNFRYDSYESYLNGTATTAESFTAVSGETYNIEYRDVWEKEDVLEGFM